MTVYIVQDQKQVDQNGQLRSKFDFTSAACYGELKFILKSNSTPFVISPAIKRMHHVLCDFSDDDYLLLVGNPALLGLSVAIAADYNGGNVKMLQWSGVKRSYIPIVAQGVFSLENILPD